MTAGCSEESRMKQVTSKKIKMLTLLGECGCLAQLWIPLDPRHKKDT